MRDLFDACLPVVATASLAGNFLLLVRIRRTQPDVQPALMDDKTAGQDRRTPPALPVERADEEPS